MTYYEQNGTSKKNYEKTGAMKKKKTAKSFLKRSTAIWLAAEFALAAYAWHEYQDYLDNYHRNPNPLADMIPANLAPDTREKQAVASTINVMKHIQNTDQESLIANDREALAMLLNRQNKNTTDVISSAVLFDSILEDGHISEEERKLQKEVLNNYVPPEDYQAWEKDRLDQAVMATLANEEIRTLAAKWKNPTTYKTEAEAAEQLALRQKMAQTLSDNIRHAFGLASIPVIIDNFTQAPVAGYYFQCDSENTSPYRCPPDTVSEESASLVDNGFIFLNYKLQLSMLDELDKMLLAIAEEAKHSVDLEIMRKVVSGEVSKDDIRYSHGIMIALNGLNTSYAMTSFEIQDNGFSISIDLPALTSESKVGRFFERISQIFKATVVKPINEYRNYKNQYIERNAKEFAEKFSHSVEKGLSGPKNTSIHNNMRPWP